MENSLWKRLRICCKTDYVTKWIMFNGKTLRSCHLFYINSCHCTFGTSCNFIQTAWIRPYIMAETCHSSALIKIKVNCCAEDKFVPTLHPQKKKGGGVTFHCRRHLIYLNIWVSLASQYISPKYNSIHSMYARLIFWNTYLSFTLRLFMLLYFLIKHKRVNWIWVKYIAI